jgi:hypothetical protein
MKSIELNIVKKCKFKGYKALVSDEDYTFLNSVNWSLSKTGGVFSVIKNVGKKKVYMHNEIMNPKNDEVVFHLNHNKLDNRRENLIKVNKSMSLYLSPIRLNKSNVWLNKKRNTWSVGLRLSFKSNLQARNFENKLSKFILDELIKKGAK